MSYTRSDCYCPNCGAKPEMVYGNSEARDEWDKDMRQECSVCLVGFFIPYEYGLEPDAVKKLKAHIKEEAIRHDFENPPLAFFGP